MPDAPIASTPTITVFTRHSATCPKRSDPQWKKCKCRKSLYIYEHGVKTVKSAKTRDWAEAEKEAQEETVKRHPVTIELRKIAEKEAAKEAAAALKSIPLKDALGQWIRGMKTQRGRTVNTYQTSVNRFLRWAAANKIVNVEDVTGLKLDKWRSEWSPKAADKESRLALNTQAALLTRIKAFFRWAIAMRMIDHNPTLALKAITTDESRTLPLTPAQFEEVLAATYKYDAGHKQEGARNGQHLRAIFLVQRWTGLRLGDTIQLAKSALQGNRIRLTTEKRATDIECILPDHVVAALTSLPLRKGEHPDYYFWSRSCSANSLSKSWEKRIHSLNKYLSLTDEHGEKIGFTSHMLRDTYAVEMLLAGVPLEKVSRLLSHKSIATTEKYYAKWVKSRLRQLEDEVVVAMRRMGATVTV